jgi:hypothetical protein
VENHANAMIRMDRFDAELKELRDVVDATTGHNSEIFKKLTEILASQQLRLKYLEDRQG